MALSLLYDPPNRRRRQFKQRSNPLAYDDIDIIKKYRLSRQLIIELTESLYEDLSPQTQRNHAISASLQVFSALRFFATGAFQELLGDSHGLSRPPFHVSSRRCLTASYAITNISLNFHLLRMKEEGLNVTSTALLIFRVSSDAWMGHLCQS